jgi:hypothetical protein
MAPIVGQSTEWAIVRCTGCGEPVSTKWEYCPWCAVKIVPLKLTPTGDGARDRLVEARINLRREN